ncbi:MAG: SRPBCC family protein [Actinomycetota bacterium]|nr:SRPBCC family protein [Actinomycetota bacterium]
MANVQTSIDIDAPVEHVWALVTDLERTSEWMANRSPA